MEHSFVKVIKKRFLVYKDLGDRTLKQLNDQEIHFRNNDTDNNIYIMVKHIHGNMLSRFTDFLTSDGEKSWRNREDEFEDDVEKGVDDLLALWEESWSCLIKTLDRLVDEDLKKEVRIRGEKHLVLDALLRQVAHYAYHVGQIVYIAKNIKKEDWSSLSIPKNGTSAFNQKMNEKYGDS